MKKDISRIAAIIMTALFSMAALSACGGGADETTAAATEVEETEAAASGEEAGATEAESGEKDPPLVYYVGPRSGGLAWNQSKIGFDDAIADLGVEGYFIAPTTPFNNAEILELMQNAKTSGADIIIGSFTDPDVYGTLLEDFNSSGIITGTLGNYAEGCTICIAPSYEERGVEYCEQLNKLAGDDTELNILTLFTAAGTATTQMNDAIIAWCEERGNAQVVDTQFVNGDAILGSDMTSSSLRAYPEINAVICADATGGLGCGTYIGENGLGDDLYVIVEANSGDCINSVIDGSIDMLVNWEYYDMGYEVTTTCVDAYYGKDYEAQTSPEPSLITAENAVEYAEEHDIDLGGAQ